MICPNMATMLCYILTDISISHRLMKRALKGAVDRSFNRLAVDNDMSTNDSVFAMANGMLGNDPITAGSKEYREFCGALNDLTYDLAKMIARDGEGATKLVQVIVKGAKSEIDADRVAKASTDQPAAEQRTLTDLQQQMVRYAIGELDESDL